jgi:hypothetical protein
LLLCFKLSFGFKLYFAVFEVKKISLPFGLETCLFGSTAYAIASVVLVVIWAESARMRRLKKRK